MHAVKIDKIIKFIKLSEEQDMVLEVYMQLLSLALVLIAI